MKRYKENNSSGYCIDDMYFCKCSMKYWKDYCGNNGKPNVLLYVFDATTNVDRDFLAKVIRAKRRKKKS